jgi:sulfide dehydrogenase cytochrome subunit
MNEVMPALALAALLACSGPAAAADFEALVRHCESCHGEDGISTDSNVPTIAGQPEPLIANAHEQFKDWTRPCSSMPDPGSAPENGDTSMCMVSESLDSITINRIAEHYAARTFRAARQSFDADRAVEGAQLHQMYCESCHPDGGSRPGYAGRLAGQWTPYLRRAIAQIRHEEMQVPRIMEHKMGQFDVAEIDALLNFWASQQE